MQALLAPLQELAEFGNIRDAIRKGTGRGENAEIGRAHV